jgi:hypothetical protein
MERRTCLRNIEKYLRAIYTSPSTTDMMESCVWSVGLFCPRYIGKETYKRDPLILNHILELPRSDTQPWSDKYMYS